MAKIRLPKTSPEIGISPIPRIAPTQTDPGAVLAGGLVSLGGQLIEQTKRKESEAKRKESEEFAIGLKNISEGSIILNDNGSINLSESIVVAENLATAPKQTLEQILGEEQTSRLLANPKFSVSSLRQEMSKRANQFRGAEAVETKHGISDMIKENGVSPQNIFAVEDAYENMVEIVDSITDINIRANAQNTVLRPIALMNEFTDVAKKEGFVSVVNYMRAIEQGQFDFLEPDKEKIYNNFQAWIGKKVKDSQTIVNGVSGINSTGSSTMDFESGTATLSDAIGQLSYVLSEEKDLPPQIIQTLRQQELLISSDYASKESVAYIFSEFEPDAVTPINTMGNNDLTFAIQNHFIPELLKKTGIEQKDYLQKVVLKAHRATDGLNPVLKNAIKSLVRTEETARSALSLLTSKDNTMFSTGKDGIFANAFTTEELTYFNSLQHYLNKEGNIKAAMEALEQQRLQTERLTGLGIEEFKYNIEEANQLVEAALGMNDGLSADASLQVQTLAEQTYARLMSHDPSRDVAETSTSALNIAVQEFRKTSMPVFNKVESAPTQDFFRSNEIPLLTNEEKGNYVEGAIIRAGKQIGLDLDQDNATNYRFLMAEVDDNGERKIQVSVKTADMNIVAIDKYGQYQTNPSKDTQPFMFYITGADFMSFRNTETQNIRNLPPLINLYENRKQEGKSDKEIVSSLKNQITQKLFGITNGRQQPFIATDSNGDPIIFNGRPVTYSSVLPYNIKLQLDNADSLENEKYITVLGILETLTTSEEVINWSKENMTDPLKSIFNLSKKRRGYRPVDLIDLVEQD